MKTLKKIFQWIFYVLLLPLLYASIALICSFITVGENNPTGNENHTIYLHTNGVHLDIAISKADLDEDLYRQLYHKPGENYISFGWGDENFYLNTRTWDDLTFGNAFGALFLKSSTLMHVTRYRGVHKDWQAIKVSARQLEILNERISQSFKRDRASQIIQLENKGYTAIDDFYKAEGSYSCIYTCNTWVNSVFKDAGLKSCLWTPFDFGLLSKY